MSWIFNPVSASSNLSVLKNGTLVGTRPILNLIEGTSVALTVADNPGATEVDATISSSAGGTSTAGAVFQRMISSGGEGSLFAELVVFGGSAFTGSGTLSTVNQAIFVPVQVATACTVYKMAWRNGATVAGNVDVGIYDENFTRLVSSGSTAQATINSIQVVDVADTALSPGSYFLAMVASSVANAFTITTLSDNTHLRACGIVTQTAALPLPATATPIAPTGAQIPLILAVTGTATF